MPWTPEQARAFNDAQTPEQAQANGAKGGIKSGESRRRQKTLREAVQAYLNAPADPEMAARLETLGLDKTMRSALTHAVGKRALDKGDPEAFKILRDTAGEAPAQVHEVKLDARAELREATTEQLESLLDE